MNVTEPHRGSLDTYETLSQGRDGLERFRILEDFGQYVLNGVQGDILEIGVGESSYFLSRIAKRFNRRLYHCDISPSKIVNPMTVPGYLSDSEEITYFEERDPNPESFKRVVCFGGSSDQFFKRVPIAPIAFAFIDGDHSYLQVKEDFWNVWKFLQEDGVVVLHDTAPPDETWINENQCGDVYKLRQELQVEFIKMDVLTLRKGCALGVGITFVRKRPRSMEFYL